MDAEATKEAIDEQGKYEIEPKWNRNAVNDAEVERDVEKPKNKSEPPKQMNDDEQKENESNEYSTDVGNTQISQPNSPKRTKKIKIYRDMQKPLEKPEVKRG